jgi:hypothetical protein
MSRALARSCRPAWLPSWLQSPSDLCRMFPGCSPSISPQAPIAPQRTTLHVVVLAAITAMEQGRRFMVATLAGDPQEAPGPSLLERGITRVVIDFWGRRRGFAALGLPRKGWGQVGLRHPFLRGVAGELHCVRPERLEMGD